MSTVGNNTGPQPLNVQQNQPLQQNQQVQQNQRQNVQRQGNLPVLTPQTVLHNVQAHFPTVPPSVITAQELLSDSLPQALRDQLSTLCATVQKDMTAVVIGSGNTAKVAVLPTKGVRGPNPSARVQEFVKSGEALFNSVMSGMRVDRPTKQELANLMWFLQAHGSAKALLSSGGQPGPARVKEGAFSLEDPNGRLEAFLQSANSYSRSSSHIKAFSKMEGCKPRGVDVRNVETPNKRQTILFNRMPHGAMQPEGGVSNMGNQRMLFLKMEPNGCRGFSTKGTGQPGEAGSASKSVKRFFANVKDFFGHALGFIQSQGQQTGVTGIQGQNNRERIPSELKTSYSALLDSVASAMTTAHAATRTLDGQVYKGDILGFIGDNPYTQTEDDNRLEGHKHEIMAILLQGKPLSDCGGVRVMLPNLESALAQFKAIPEELRNQITPKNLETLMNTAILTLRGRGDHHTLRLGNEVILLENEMSIGTISLVKKPQPGATVQSSGTFSPREENGI